MCAGQTNTLARRQTTGRHLRVGRPFSTGSVNTHRQPRTRFVKPERNNQIPATKNPNMSEGIHRAMSITRYVVFRFGPSPTMPHPLAFGDAFWRPAFSLRVSQVLLTRPVSSPPPPPPPDWSAGGQLFLENHRGLYKSLKFSQKFPLLLLDPLLHRVDFILAIKSELVLWVCVIVSAAQSSDFVLRRQRQDLL